MAAVQTFYEIATSRLDEQTERGNGLDAKLATTFGFSAAILPIFGVLLAIAKTDRPRAAVVAYLIAMAVYVVMNGLAIAAYRVSTFSYRPDLDTLQTHCKTLTDDVLRQWVANECVLSILSNDPLLRTKAWRANWALGLLAAEALLLTVAAFLTLT